MERRFQNKTVIVTGGTKGIGRATTLRFLREGARVAVIDMEAATGDVVAALQRDAGTESPRLFYNNADVTSEREVVRAVEHCEASAGPVAILVNNVGMGANPTPLESIALAEWERFLAINATSTFLVTRAVLPGMRQRGYGRIVNLASTAGRTVSPLSSVAYSASKAAIMGLTRKLAYEEAANGILVNAVAPGIVFTDRVKARFDGLDDAAREARFASVPLRRPAQPEEIAAAILFLASEDASYITGVTLDVNGGSFMG